MFAELKTKWMDLWDKTRPKLVFTPIAVDQSDKKDDYQSLEYGKHYLRLWLTEMYLTPEVKYFQTLYPAVHALVKFEFEGKPVEFPTIADASTVKMKKMEKGQVAAKNFILTPLLPFNSGVLELEAGLLAVQGVNFLDSFITTLSDFAGLLAVPQFSTALELAGPLANGMQKLFGLGEMQLAMHTAFTLHDCGGYFAVIRATEDMIKPGDLVVANNELRLKNKYDPSLTHPLEDYDHLLFRVELLTERPDWDQLPTIVEPMRKANQALKDLDEDKAGAFLREAIIAAHESPELTQADRTRVKLKLRQDFDQLKKDLGFSLLSEKGEYSLSKSMGTAISVEAALQRGEPSFLELLGA